MRATEPCLKRNRLQSESGYPPRIRISDLRPDPIHYFLSQPDSLRRYQPVGQNPQIFAIKLCGYPPTNLIVYVNYATCELQAIIYGGYPLADADIHGYPRPADNTPDRCGSGVDPHPFQACSWAIRYESNFVSGHNMRPS